MWQYEDLMWMFLRLRFQSSSSSKTSRASRSSKSLQNTRKIKSINLYCQKKKKKIRERTQVHGHGSPQGGLAGKVLPPVRAPDQTCPWSTKRPSLLSLQRRRSLWQWIQPLTQHHWSYWRPSQCLLVLGGVRGRLIRWGLRSAGQQELGGWQQRQKERFWWYEPWWWWWLTVIKKMCRALRTTQGTARWL